MAEVQEFSYLITASSPGAVAGAIHAQALQGFDTSPGPKARECRIASLIGARQTSAMDDSRNRGTQPVEALMERWGLGNHDMVDASPEQLTHKQVQRARKGRMLTLAMMQKVTRTLNIAVWYRLKKDEREEYFEYLHKHLFDYAKGYDPAFEDPNAPLMEKVRERGGKIVSREP